MSSVSASGVGGNVGGTMMPTARDIETSAITVVNKERMGLVHDTMEIPFTQVGGNVWKYSSDSTRPTLMPTGTMRTMSDEIAKADESWKQSFDELVGKLPPDLKEDLINEMGKRAENRSPNFNALAKTLTNLAKGMAWMEQAKGNAEPGTVEGERIRHNQSLPGRALKGVVGQGKSMLQGAESFLNKVGPNYSHHDGLRHFLKESGELQGRMESFLEILSDPNQELPTQEQMNNLSEDIGTLSRDFSKTSQGDNLQIMGTMLETMESVAQALSMTPTSPSLFLGMKTALKGIFSSESEAALFGGNFEALIAALQSGMLATMMKKLGPAKLKMLMMLLMGGLAGSGSLGAILGEKPARHPEDEDNEEEEQKFTFDLSLELIESSGILKVIYSIIAAACGLDTQGQEKTANLMELASLLMVAFGGAEGKFNRVPPILKGYEDKLGHKVEDAEKFVNEALMKGALNSAGAKSLDIALQQAIMALSQGNLESFVNVLQGVIGQLNANPEGLGKEAGKIKQFAKLVKHAFGTGLESETQAVTGMIHAA